MEMLQPSPNFLSFLIFNFCPRLVCFSQRTFGSHYSLFCQSRGNVASPSHVKPLSWLIETERFMQASTCSCQAALYHPQIHFCQHTTLSTQIRFPPGCGGLTFLVFIVSPCTVCFTALPVALQRALTQKAGLRTQRTATWLTLWSGSSPASLTRCAQRAA